MRTSTTSILQSGTSELKTWIAAAGVLFDAPISGDTVGYVPCYRSHAGTGTANGFVAWQLSMTDEIAARLAAFDCCALSDALDSLALTGAVTGLIATSPGQRIAGRVHTVKLAAGKPPAGAPARHLCAAAIDASERGRHHRRRAIDRDRGRLLGRHPLAAAPS